MVTILLLLMAGNLKSISLSEVASDNIILIQSYIKISQLFRELLEHIQSHPPITPPPHTPTHPHTHTHIHTHTQARGKYDQSYENNFV